MQIACLVLEYFPLKPGSLRILPPPPTPPPPKPRMLKFSSRVNNIDQGGVRGGVIMVPNSQGWSPLSNKVQNS